MKLLASLLFLVISSFSLQAQIVAGPDTVNEEMVTELSAVQTKTGTFLAALMIGKNTSNGVAMIIYRSTDNGATWDSVYIKKWPNYLVQFPDPVLSTDAAGNVYAACMGGNSTYYDIWFFKSTDDGLTWNFVSKPYGNSDLFCDLPSLSSRGNGLVYCSYSAGNPFITFVRSSDGGNTWTNSHNFPPPLPGGNVYPSHLDWTINNKLCLSYADMTNPTIAFTTSKDSGATWAALKYITIPASSNVTKIVSHKNFAHLGIVAHKPHVNTDIYYLTSLDTGNTWTYQTISSNSANAEGVIDAAGNVHVIYNEITAPTSRLAYKYSMDKGLTFSTAVTLLPWTNGSGGTAGEYQSLILAQDGLLHITYIDWDEQGAARHLVFAPLLTDIYQIDPNTHAPRIYPNPAHDVLSMESDNTNTNATYDLSTLEGKTILSGNLEIPKTSVNISELKPGIYLLRVSNSKISYVQKVVKE
jgi:hypothetical protein